MNYTKADIRKNLREGKMREALDQALAYAEYCNLPDIMNGLTTQAAKLSLHKKNAIGGLLDYPTLARSQAQITHDLLGWTDRLPDVPKPAKGKRRPWRLATFKKGVFYAILVTKLIVLGRLFYLQSTGAFSEAELQATAALLAPAFAAYISVMLADYLRQTKTTAIATRYVSGPLITFAFWLFPFYPMILIFILNGKPAERWDFGGMMLWLGLAESVLGGYIGQIVQALFKKD